MIKKSILFFFFLINILSLVYIPNKTYAATCGGTCVDNELTCTAKGFQPDSSGNTACTEFGKNICCKGMIVDVTQPNNVKITELGKLIGALISAVFVIAGLIAFVFLIWGGIQWITSGGDKAGVEAAQKRIQAAFIGLIIVVASWAIMKVVSSFLGIDIFNLSFSTPF
jgi:hypothetical protein